MSSQPGPSKPENGLQKLNAAADEVEVEWEITLEIPFGDNTFEVIAEDSSGNQDSEPDTVLVRHSRFPPNAVLDNTNNRLVGLETFSNGLALDLVNNTISEIPGISTGQLLAVNTEGTLVYSFTNFDQAVSFRSQDLNNGLESVENSFTFTFDELTWENAALWDTVYIESENLLYLLYQMIPLSGEGPTPPWESRLYSWNITEDAPTQIPLSIEEGSVPIITSIAMGDTQLIGLTSPFLGGYTNNSLLSIDTTTGALSLIADELQALASTFTVDSAGEYAYLAGYDEVTRVTVETGEATQISVDADQEFFNLAQISNVILDESRNQLLVSDIALREMIKVDIQTGERSLLYPNGIGEGRKLIAPRELALSVDNNTAYVLDDGDNSPESLFSINLETGDRTRLGSINNEFNRGANGLALDETGNRVFYALNSDIYMMDLATQNITTVSSDSVGTGTLLQGVSGLHFNSETNELLVTDPGQDILVSINPETKDRQLIFLLTEGETAPIEVPLDVALSVDGSTYYVLGQQLGALYSVDTATGAREVLLEECVNGSDQNLLPEDSAIQNMDFNAVTGKFLITGDNSVIEYDLAEDNCRIISNQLSVFDLLYKNDGTVLGATWNRLLQFDPVNGAFVTISK